MVKLVDMPDLGSGAARRVGSSPIIRTEKASEKSEAFLFLGFHQISPLLFNHISDISSFKQHPNLCQSFEL